ncbi:MAG: 30S ribosome-binding factor RbfA [Chloroflexi bacterium]|nr:30S ribosome-binding factor RbfA [Chloroflexota bacterium]
MTRRIDRISALMLQEISLLVTTELKDPRLATVVSVTRVEVTSDLHTARVFISVLGDDEEKKKSIRALRSASGFIHHQLQQSLNLRAVPHLIFKLDETIERSAELFALMREVNSGNQTTQ